MAESSTITRKGGVAARGARIVSLANFYPSCKSLMQIANNNAAEKAQAFMYPPRSSPGGIRSYAFPTAPIRKDRAERTANIHLISLLRRMSDSILEYIDLAESAVSISQRRLAAAIYPYGLEIAALATGGARG